MLKEPIKLNFGAKEGFALIIAVILITDITIFLNILFLRQTLGFLFLTLLPGVLILQLLKLNKIGFLEKFILAWGLSISFLMFFGLLLNNLLFSLGYETPLATIPLLISFNVAFIVFGIIGYRINKNPTKTNFLGKNLVKHSMFASLIRTIKIPNFFIGLTKVKNHFSNLNLSTEEKTFLIVPILFPALSIFGMHVMNTTDNNIILMFLLFLIPTYVAFVCFFDQKFSKRLYPVVILLISISLLLLLSLRSNHILGMDAHFEYYHFHTTLKNLHWSIMGYYAHDACLAISLLPTIYQSILNIPPEFLFKILYSLIYSISPLVIYVLSNKYIGEKYAFLASCFFMFQSFFLGTAGNARTNTALLFFALAMMILFNDKIDPVKKRLLFIVFIASCIVSHYSTAYIFFFIMLGSFFGMEILSRKYTFKKVISLTIVVLFFAFIFFWYSQVTETAFNAGVVFIENTFSNLNNFFIEESRDMGLYTMLGKGIRQETIPVKIRFVFTWLTFVLIGIGIITLIIRRNGMSFPELNFKKPCFLKDKFEVGYFVTALLCTGLLVVMVALPYMSKGYSIDRLYGVAITILSVFFVIGGITLSKTLSFIKKALLKKGRKGAIWKEKEDASQNIFRERDEEKNGLEVRTYLIILLVLIPYFLCVSGAMYNIFGDPNGDIILNSEGLEYDTLYMHDQDSYGMTWLVNYNKRRQIIYGDAMAVNLLRGDIINPRRYRSLQSKGIRGYIYLRYCNVVDGKLLDWQGEWHNITEYENKFVDTNKIYDSGGSEVWI